LPRKGIALLLMENKEDVSKYSPDYEIDLFWHTHMLHPQVYIKDCLNSFGFLLNHTPNAENSHDDLKSENLDFELKFLFFSFAVTKVGKESNSFVNCESRNTTRYIIDSSIWIFISFYLNIFFTQ
jgi:hypothetical protein